MRNFLHLFVDFLLFFFFKCDIISIAHFFTTNPEFDDEHETFILKYLKNTLIKCWLKNSILFHKTPLPPSCFYPHHHYTATFSIIHLFISPEIHALLFYTHSPFSVTTTRGRKSKDDDDDDGDVASFRLQPARVLLVRGKTIDNEAAKLYKVEQHIDFLSSAVLWGLAIQTLYIAAAINSR